MTPLRCSLAPLTLTTMRRCTAVTVPRVGHVCLALCEGAPGDPAAEPASGERGHDRGRSHERKHHSSSATAAEKHRYYSCDRYSSREHCHTKSATTSCATSPSEGQDTSFNKQVGGFAMARGIWAGQDTSGHLSCWCRRVQSEV